MSVVAVLQSLLNSLEGRGVLILVATLSMAAAAYQSYAFRGFSLEFLVLIFVITANLFVFYMFLKTRKIKQ